MMSNKIAKELVTCILCHDFFNFPKTLPCLHTFCENCLQQQCTQKKAKRRFSLRKSEKCPTCKNPFYHPKGGIKELKTDTRIKKMTAFVMSLEATGCSSNEENSSQLDHKDKHKHTSENKLLHAKGSSHTHSKVNAKTEGYEEDEKQAAKQIRKEHQPRLMPLSYSSLGRSHGSSVFSPLSDSIPDITQSSPGFSGHVEYPRCASVMSTDDMMYAGMVSCRGSGWPDNGLFGVDPAERTAPVFRTWLAILIFPS